MTLENPPEDHAETILEVFEGLESADIDVGTGMASEKINSELPDHADYSGQEVLEYLISQPEEPLVRIEDDKLVSVRKTAFRHYFDLSEPYEPPEDVDVGALALDFAKWLKREEDVLPVLMDKIHDPEDCLLYCYNPDSGVWKKNGSAVLQDRIGDELPERNAKAFRGRVQRALFGEHYAEFDRMGVGSQELAVQDGLLDFKTGMVRDIEREDRVLNRLPVSHSEMPEEYPEEWMSFLEEVTQDEKAIKTLQEFVGYSLMHWTRKYGKMLMLLGTTQTGKSTFLNVVEELLGESNVSNQPLEDLCSDGSAGRWSPNHLEGKLANIVPDLDGDKIERQGRAKKLTEDGESINAERKRVSHYEIEPNAKHMYAANSPPSANRHEDAFYNRFLTLKFDNQIPRGEQDEDLEDRLTEPEVLNGIFKWALDGMQRLQNQGEFTREPGSLATKELFNMYDSGPKRFVHEVCELKYKASEEDRKAKDWRISSAKLHEHYQEWAEDRTEFSTFGIQKFSGKVHELPNVEETRVRVEGVQKNGHSGIRLKPGAVLSSMEDSGGAEGGE